MAKREFTILPRRWKGIRNSEAPVLLDPDEWADSLNFDARFGWSNPGKTLIETVNLGQAVLGVSHFFDKDGTIHRVVVLADGNIYEDNVLVTSKPFSPTAISVTDTSGPIPHFAPGKGGMALARGTSLFPLFRNATTGVWEELTAAPKFEGIVMDPDGPRLFGFPNSTGEPDTWSWSSIGDFTKWAVADGGGTEPIKEDRQKLVGLSADLENDIVIYKRGRIYVRQGSNPDTWKITLVSNDVGLDAPNSLLKIGKSHFFVHESGAYFLNAVGSISFPPLTFPIQETWDKMLKDFGSFLKFAHAAYHPREHTVHLWIPNQASRIMNRLVKIYVPTGAVTIHDDKDAGGSDFFLGAGTGQLTFGSGGGKIFDAVGVTNDGTDITSKLTPGIFSGTPPTMDKEKRWGNRGIVFLYFQTEASISITITPRVYQLNKIINGPATTTTLAANQISKVALKLPADQGWGFDFILSGTVNSGRWRLLGYSGLYEEITSAA